MIAAGTTPASGGEGGGFSASRVRRNMVDLAAALDPRDLAPVAVDDRVLDGPGGPLPLRCYVPPSARAAAASADAAAGLIYFHGGAGVFGSVQTHDAVCRMIALDAAVTVISVEYRLAPEHPYPAGLDDAWHAAQWIAEHCAQLGLDPRRLAIGGDSAGATLATVVCGIARDHGGPAFAAQLLLCPVTDLCAQNASREEFANGYFLTRALLDWAIEQYCPPGTDRRDPRLSPLHAADLSRLPPAHVHTAEFDPMRDEGAAYAQALERAGVPVRYRCHAGLIHHFYGMAGAIPAARAALAEAAQDLGRLLERPGQQATKNSV
jgi:acetyl esterase/lipase